MLSARLMGRRHSEPHLSFRNHWEGSVRHQKLTKELHSEELSDQVTELQVESQESELLDSSPSLLSFDTAIDRDVAAQAGQGEPQVFDFDMQVKPLLKVLIGKTVEQALLEVVVEEELAYQWEQQCVYIDQCNAELADVQRLKEQGR
ncbi:radial spoke head protein 3 homolog B-like isoform X2 [Apteryx mantelli]|uniref:Radial spoke head protein 3 homolog B-like isoform X2 n=1 Tax=Apteryx mantelli TaxID=2696672 RepID=A0ABM4EAN9_9AVES